MNTSEKIIAMQTIIINKLILCEEAIADLYASYAISIPEMAEFWQALSNKETGHAGLLKSMNKQLKTGHIFHNIGRFKLDHIENFLCLIQEATTDANNHSISKKAAIKTAVGIESSILDAEFYNIVKSDSPDYRIIAEKLSSDTNEHLKSVQDMLLKIQ